MSEMSPILWLSCFPVHRKLSSCEDDISWAACHSKFRFFGVQLRIDINRAVVLIGEGKTNSKFNPTRADDASVNEYVYVRATQVPFGGRKNACSRTQNVCVLQYFAHHFYSKLT
jgi:hypothetical protein